MASWTMSPGFIVSFRLLEMLFIGAQRPRCGLGRLNINKEAGQDGREGTDESDK